MTIQTIKEINTDWKIMNYVNYTCHLVLSFFLFYIIRLLFISRCLFQFNGDICSLYWYIVDKDDKKVFFNYIRIEWTKSHWKEKKIILNTTDNKSNQQNEFYLSIEPVWTVFPLLTGLLKYLTKKQLQCISFKFYSHSAQCFSMYVIVMLTFFIYYYFGLWTCTVASLPLSNCLNRQLNSQERRKQRTNEEIQLKKKFFA